MDDNHYSPAPPEPEVNSNDGSESAKVILIIFEISILSDFF